MGYRDKLLSGAVLSQLLVPERRGRVCHVEVRHDHDCPLLLGKGDCTCDAEIAVLPPGARP